MKIEPGFYASPRWSWEILDCAMPMTFDTYSNCAHQCVYCFAYFQRALGTSADAYLSHRVKGVDVERVKRMFLDPDEHAGQFAPYIKARYVLQWGGLSDGFDWYERKLRKSLELLRFFREIDYPVSISTKGVWFLDDPEYVEVLRDARNTHWKYSIICLDPEAARRLEAGTPTPEERYEAMERLSELGVGATTLRFRPYVIGVSNHDMPRMFEMARDSGCYSITTEFLCIEKRASANHKERYRKISEVVGYDVWSFYRQHSYSGSGLMRLNYELKRPYVRAMEAKAAEVGLPFFVSDAHHKEASAGGGCCGLPKDGPLATWNRGQFSEAMQIAKHRGAVRFSDIAKEAEWLKTLSWTGAEGYNVGTTAELARRKYQTMFDFMRSIWNSPKSWQSPARYFGGALVPAGKDEDGDLIYVYNRPWVEEGEKSKTVPDLLARVAQLKEHQRADGESSGHVAYPIFVTSKLRAGRATVLDVFAESRLNPILVVEPQETDDYRAAYPHVEQLVLPEDDRGLTFARQWVLDRAREDGLSWFWLFDDNIRGFQRGTEPATARAALSYVEALTADYDNIAIAALDYQQFAFRQTTPFSANRKAYCSTLMNATAPLDYDPRFANMKGDVDLCIGVLETGEWCTVLVHKYAMIKPAMGGGQQRGGNAGGLSANYRDREDEREAEMLIEKWPGVVRLIDKGSWTDARVDWSRYRHALRPVLLERVLDPNWEEATG